MGGMGLLLTGLQEKLIDLLGLTPESAAAAVESIARRWNDGHRLDVWKIAEPLSLRSMFGEPCSVRTATIYIGRLADPSGYRGDHASPCRIDDFDGKIVWEWSPHPDATARIAH